MRPRSAPKGLRGRVQLSVFQIAEDIFEYLYQSFSFQYNFFKTLLKMDTTTVTAVSVPITAETTPQPVSEATEVQAVVEQPTAPPAPVVDQPATASISPAPAVVTTTPTKVPVTVPVAVSSEDKESSSPEAPSTEPIKKDSDSSQTKKPHVIVRAVTNMFGSKKKGSGIPDAIEQDVGDTSKIGEITQQSPLDTLKDEAKMQEVMDHVTSTSEFQTKVQGMQLEQTGNKIGKGVAEACFGPIKEEDSSSFSGKLGEEMIKSSVDKNIKIEALKPIATDFLKGVMGPVEESIEQNMQVSFWKAMKYCCM
eukprot:TRINITY_DN1580_c0_g1_i2.p1 TRINITY_DN1580_c0_g1~~TRINITY_DN1580_c0_g1_i2.p1  ORF type:complete len:308 (-),score=41.42 TRINITY_DN1580_c0_g1_i2:638-1561(-)